MWLESQLSRMNCQIFSTGLSSGHLAGSAMMLIFSGTRATIVTAAPRKRVQFLLENRLDGGADIFPQTILNGIAAQFIGQ